MPNYYVARFDIDASQALKTQQALRDDATKLAGVYGDLAKAIAASATGSGGGNSTAAGIKQTNDAIEAQIAKTSEAKSRWDALLETMQETSKAARDFARADLAGDPITGQMRSPGSVGADERDTLLATAAAKRFDLIRALQQQETAEQSLASAQARTNAAQEQATIAARERAGAIDAVAAAQARQAVAERNVRAAAVRVDTAKAANDGSAESIRAQAQAERDLAQAIQQSERANAEVARAEQQRATATTRLASAQERNADLMREATRQARQERGEIDALAAAKERLEDAERAVSAATTAVGASMSGNGTEAQRVERQMQAEEALTRALQRRAQVSAEVSRQEVAAARAVDSANQNRLREANALAEAQERYSAAQRRGSYTAEVAGASPQARVDAAARRQAEANERLAQTERDLISVRQSGVLSMSTQAVAYRRVADAQEEATRATLDLASAQQALSHEDANLARLRYAMFDISQSATIMGAAFVAGTGLAVVGAANMERAFADVIRTTGITGAAAASLRQEFLELSQTIPVSFQDIAQIGTLAGQLGIAENQIAGFTRTVAMFSATTDVTVDASATAFGRLNELIRGVDGRFENLGSAILAVGVDSVATESEIIAISAQIAATGDQAGLSADEIIGLSGALASLGVAPEAARGTVLRVFSQINGAISAGGERLEQFASISGMTADEFREGWGSDFTTTFLAFLEGIGGQGGQAEAALRALGITATRDINAMLKLGQNYEFVGDTLQTASAGFGNAGLLAESFGVISETTSAKAQIFVQTLQGLFATVGALTNGPLGSLIEIGTQVLILLTDLAQTQFGSWAAAAVVGLTALVGAMLLAVGAGTRLYGSILAVRQANADFAASTAGAAAAQRGFAASLGLSAGAARALRLALVSTGVGVALLGIGALTELLISQADAANTAEGAVESYFGTAEGLGAALIADNPGLAQHAEAQEQVAETALSASASLGEQVEALVAQQAAAQAAEAALEGTSNAIDASTARIGENTQAWLRNYLTQSEQFQELITNAQTLQGLIDGSGTFTLNQASMYGGDTYSETIAAPDFSLQALTDAATQGGTDGATAYYDAYVAQLVASFENAGIRVNSETLSSLLDTDSAETLEQIEAFANALDAAVNEAERQAVLEEFAGSLSGIGTEAEIAGEGVTSLSDSTNQLIDDLYGASNAEYALQDSLSALGSAFAENGADASANGQAIQEVIRQIMASTGGGPAAGAQMQQLFDHLIQGGYASEQQLWQLRAAIDSVSGGAVGNLIQQMSSRVLALNGISMPKAPTLDFSGFANGFASGMKKVEKAAGGGGGGGGGGAAKAIRTLVDYANDLAKVFDRAFEIRFSGMEAADKVASAWLKIREETTKAQEAITEATEDARQALLDFQAESARLSSDKSISQYWLSIAESYGDVLRAGELRADIAEIDAKMAKAAADNAKAQQSASTKITDAQGRTNRTLVGNSEAAIENRATILGLVGSYQDQVRALAASGLSQADLATKTEQLRQDFLRQAQQLGFNSQELGIYAAAFDDVAIAIANVPRNITVQANVNAALQAMNELNAAAQRATNGGRGYSVPVSSSYDNAGMARAARANEIYSRIAEAQAQITRLQATSNPFAYAQIPAYQEVIRRFTGALNSGNFYGGGYTGNMGTRQTAGIVHGREFVMPADATAGIGLDALEYMRKHQSLPAVGIPVGGGGSVSDAQANLWGQLFGMMDLIASRIGLTITGTALQESVSVQNIADGRSGR